MVASDLWIYSMKKKDIIFKVDSNFSQLSGELNKLLWTVYTARVETQVFICQALKAKVADSKFFIRWFWKLMYRKEFNRLKSIRKEYYEKAQRHTYL